MTNCFVDDYSALCLGDRSENRLFIPRGYGAQVNDFSGDTLISHQAARLQAIAYTASVSTKSDVPSLARHRCLAQRTAITRPWAWASHTVVGEMLDQDNGDFSGDTFISQQAGRLQAIAYTASVSNKSQVPSLARNRCLAQRHAITSLWGGACHSVVCDILDQDNGIFIVNRRAKQAIGIRRVRGGRNL